MQLAIPKTPEFLSSRHDPQTPARDPAAIDRRGLVGVGELTTPRWVQSTSSRRAWEGKEETVAEEGEPADDDAEDVDGAWNDVDNDPRNAWTDERHEESQVSETLIWPLRGVANCCSWTGAASASAPRVILPAASGATTQVRDLTKPTAQAIHGF